jgi:hypothetical protein
MTHPDPEPQTNGHGHIDDHLAGHADDHGGEHDELPPGPIDWGAWLVSLVGIVAGSVVALVIAQSIAAG